MPQYSHSKPSSAVVQQVRLAYKYNVLIAGLHSACEMGKNIFCVTSGRSLIGTGHYQHVQDMITNTECTADQYQSGNSMASFEIMLVDQCRDTAENKDLPQPLKHSKFIQILRILLDKLLQLVLGCTNKLIHLLIVLPDLEGWHGADTTLLRHSLHKDGNLKTVFATIVLYNAL